MIDDIVELVVDVATDIGVAVWGYRKEKNSRKKRMNGSQGR